MAAQVVDVKTEDEHECHVEWLMSHYSAAVEILQTNNDRNSDKSVLDGCLFSSQLKINSKYTVEKNCEF